MPLLTISAPGTYFIDSDMTQTNPNDDAIRIAPGVHYVNIILRGGRLVGAGGPSSTNAGIHAVGNAAVTVIGQGGSIRGFGYGLHFEDTLIPRIDGVFVQDALFRGIKIEGDDAYVADCDIRDVHGATWTPNAYCMGIEVQGMTTNGRPKILRNLVQTVHGTGSGESVGISLSDNSIGGMVSGNIIKNDTKAGMPFGLGACIGLWLGGAGDITTGHNTLDYWDYGIANSLPDGRRGQNMYVNCTIDFYLYANGGTVTIANEDA